MIFDRALHEIVTAFGQLWKAKERGNTLEIITPFTTTQNQFVSVFLSVKDNQFIVSDGGWISMGEYEIEIDLEEETFSKILNHYQESFDVQQFNANELQTYYFRSTNDERMISSVVFDMATFISSIVSASAIQFVDKVESEEKERFVRQANSFLTSFIPREDIKLNEPLVRDGRRGTIKFNAIITRRNRFTLVNYITGSNPYHFTNSIGKANLLFGMAKESRMRSYIKKEVSVINNSAPGFIPSTVTPFLDHLRTNQGVTTVLWSDRETLYSILN